MVNRPAGGARSKRHEREPYDWYCDSPREVRQIMRDGRIDLDGDLIYDPSCGRGNILDVAAAHGHATLGSDLFDRRCPIAESPASARHDWFRADFLKSTPPRALRGRPFSIFNNPPYSYQTDICERFIAHALEHYPARWSIFLVPIAFLASEDRWAFFERAYKPAKVAIFSQRPSMPPGSKVTRYTDFKGGMQDYIALAYRSGNGHRWRTETIWIRPD